MKLSITSDPKTTWGANQPTNQPPSGFQTFCKPGHVRRLGLGLAKWQGSTTSVLHRASRKGNLVSREAIGWGKLVGEVAALLWGLAHDKTILGRGTYPRKKLACCLKRDRFNLERIVCQPSVFRGLCLLVFGKLPRNNKKQSKNENSLSFSFDHPSQNSCRRWDFTSTARSAKGMNCSQSGMPRWNKPTYQLVTNFHGHPIWDSAILIPCCPFVAPGSRKMRSILARESFGSHGVSFSPCDMCRTYIPNILNGNRWTKKIVTIQQLVIRKPHWNNWLLKMWHESMLGSTKCCTWKPKHPQIKVVVSKLDASQSLMKKLLRFHLGTWFCFRHDTSSYRYYNFKLWKYVQC